jgi:hypothetical protein
MDTSKISNLISKKNNSIELFSLKNIIQSNFQNFIPWFIILFICSYLIII